MTTILPINTELKQNFAPLGKLRFAINLGNAVLAGKNAHWLDAYNLITS
jgi:hypothetical protein